MSGSSAFFADAAARAARREPFATATVVRAERPTSAKPGAKAIVTADGELLGWIGGSCAEPVVVREALAALADGSPRLVALSSAPLPPRQKEAAGPGEAGVPRGRAQRARVGSQALPPGRSSRDGVRHFPMTCHSGGALEIYIEPVIPSEQLVVVGRTPVARALGALGATLGLRVVAADPRATLEDFPSAAAVVADLADVRADERTAIVIATRGDHDEEAVQAALATPAPYVGLVASRTRGDVLVRTLAEGGVPQAALARLRYPAGLDIDARSEEEIALSILAEIVLTRGRAARAEKEAARPSVETARPSPPAEALDPICGMSVAITADALTAIHEGTTYYFCGSGCVRRFLADPVAALARRFPALRADATPNQGAAGPGPARPVKR